MPTPSRYQEVPDPDAVAVESTSAVIIGTGLSGLAVAAELNRLGVDAVTLDGLESPSPSTATAALRIADLSSAESAEHLEVLRHLRKHAACHSLDVRHHVMARHLALAEGREDGEPARWAVRTERGLVFADAVVLTRCAHNQLRRFLADLGYSLGEHLLEALAQIGLYLVGVTELAAPSTREMLRQAKHVGVEVAARTGAGLQPA